jgi:hypothetical protein
MTIQKRIRYISLLLFLVVPELNAQVIQLKWITPVVMLDTNFKPQEVLYFSGAKTSKDLLPHYQLQLYNVAIGNFTLINPQYQALSETEIALLRDKILPVGIDITVGVQNRQPISTVSFVPIRMSQTGAYEKLISFSYQYEKIPFSVTQYTASKTPPNNSAPNARTNAVAATGGSVLASGVWHKVAISSTGLYKIDYAFLQNMGLNPAAINPANVNVFGNGFGMLPQPNSAYRPTDLLQNSTLFSDAQTPGVFDQGDYVLFYGKGPDTWTYDTTETIFNHTKNIYTDYSCYFINCDNTTSGAHIQSQVSLGSGAQTINYFDEHLFHESDLTNLLSSGRVWYGETINGGSDAVFQFNTTGIVSGSSIKLTSAVLGRSTSATQFNVYIGNGGSSSVFLGYQPISANNLFQYDQVGVLNRAVFTLPSSSSIGNPSTVSVNLNYTGPASAIGQLDYLELNIKRNLALYGSQTSFRTIASTAAATTTYEIANTTASSTIWDVTDITSVKSLSYTLGGSIASFSDNSTILKEYIVFNGNNFPNPNFIGEVQNQNLHGTIAPNIPDMVIVTFPDFYAEAMQLKNFRKSQDNIDVQVVTTEQIYNEFSSGAQDVSAIRDYMKMLFNNKSGTDSIRYLLLFGDCSYDYKNRLAGNTNYVPVYESYESLYPLASYSSDDYFGLLDDVDGAWPENPADNEFLDIGVGRLPVKSSSEASAVVSKLIHYSSDQSCIGKWRNSLTFLADDGESNLFVIGAEDLTGMVDTTYQTYNINKIYLDAYLQTPTPGGEVAPEVNAKIIESVNNGTLILNYNGHGGETQLAQEDIVDIPQIEGWNNFNNMPLMITATCDFGRYDDPLIVSGGEIAVIKEGGGAIGIICSARVVYQYSNIALNESIFDNIFKPLPYGKMPRLGDVMRLSKNEALGIVPGSVNNRNYALLSDPSLMLTYPSQNIVITKVNIDSVLTAPDTIKALAKVLLGGEVRLSNVLSSSFNGNIHITVYDKRTSITTYGTEGGPTYTFTLRDNVLFDGNATVKNGKWSVYFVVPKDISYQYDFGKISMYAEKSGTLTDAGGYYANIVIGGTDPNAPADNTPPVIKMYMNDESFVYGGITDKDALFLAKLSDENGINTSTSGIGHELAATLDNAGQPTILNQFYTANLNDYKNGTVKYPYTNLAAGHHSIQLKAWDTYNNSAEGYLEFIVASSEKIALSHILNYPNPFSTHTVFNFDHNRAGEELDVMVQIYTVSGKLIKTLDSKEYMSNSHFSGLDWDGRDDFGDKIGKGVYVYKVWVRAPRDGSSALKFEKLVILN